MKPKSIKSSKIYLNFRELDNKINKMDLKLVKNLNKLDKFQN